MKFFLLFLLFSSIDACPLPCKCGEGKVECRVPASRDFPLLGWPRNTTILNLSGNNILNLPRNSMKNLFNLKELILDGNKIFFLEKKVFEGLSKFRKLSIQDANLHFIEPEVFSDLPELEELYLTGNSINEFPNIEKNMKLKILCVSSNKIEMIPENAFSNNTQLSELKLTRNKLTSLPRHAFPDDVTSYTVLSLVGNLFRNIPDVAKEMRNLRNLSLCHNPIKVLKAQEFVPFKNIKMLSMTNVGLLEIAKNVFEMATLEELYLGWNSISAESLANFNLPNLKILVLQGNPLHALTGNPFSLLSKLEKLDLSECDIQRVDSQALKFLSNLRSLNLRGNRLLEIPDFEHSVNLERLDLSGNNISLIFSHTFRVLRIKELNLSNNLLQNFNEAFPEGTFSRLTSLDLSHNSFQHLPGVIMNEMLNLEALNLAFNKLRNISGQYQNLPKLKSLNLRGNNLTTISNQTFPDLTSLVNLYLCKNQLEDIHPLALSRFSNLQEFTADKNRLRKIDENIFASNVNLKKISLSNNEIRDLGKRTFYKLRKLRELQLLYNQLTELPKLDHNINLRVLGLCWNPLGDLPQAALNGPRALEVLLLQSVGLTHFSSNILTNPGKLKFLNLASGNYLTSVPSAIKQMKSMEVLKLAGNPITSIRSTDFDHLNYLKEIRLDNMKLTSFDVTTLFHKLPALRKLSLASNPWRCDCEMEKFVLEMDGNRVGVEAVDRHLMRCAAPKRYDGRKIDYLRSDDFRQCVRSLVKRVNSTSVRIDLPDISTVALDHPDGVHHRITYQPLVGKREKLMTVGSDQRAVTIAGLTPNTKYIVCTKIVTSKQSELEYDEKQTCHQFVTKTADGQETTADTNGNTGSSTNILVIIYSVIGAVVGAALVVTLVLITIRCHKAGIKRHNHFANISDEVKEAPMTRAFDQQSTNGHVKDTSIRQKEPSDVMLTNGNHVNEAYNVTKVRTKV